MHELLYQKLTEKITLNPEEFETVKAFFIPRTIKKRQYLLQQDDVAKYLAFINRGALRLYTLDNRGNDISVQFGLEGWWMTDNYSYLTGEPTIYNIEALEDSELLLMHRDKYEQVFDAVPKFERFVRILLQNNFIATQRRLISSLSLSAEDRYTSLANAYPEIIRRIPQHMIASYLGITPETLSRIRKQLIKA
ncbi:Crp/Fnr family transcriptional regulator [Pedobacter sp. SYSU D00535]|uniref:Crp/Fnr family transcriptional regulator n=1 Tax=Pedobacter sp. SYSU D00535 TaxID=2810308 RepID=UPI001A958392|nr:Crp/Fnr family transcriptional regulator [Pedobacter sp. SYSU D00535]